MTDPALIILQARELIRDDQPEAARRLLQSVLRCEPANEAAWWCYLQTFDRRQDRLAILEAFAREFPDHPRLGHLVQKLREPGNAQRMADTRPILTREAVVKKKEPTRGQPLIKFLPWGLLAGVLVCLVVSAILAYRAYSDLEQRFNILMNQYLILDQTFKDLSEEYVAMLAEFDALNHAYARLQADYRSLEEGYTALQVDYASLETAYDQLSVDYGNLETGYYALEESYLTLDRQAIKPPYIYIHQRKIVMAFFRDDGELLYWNVPFESLEEAIEQGYDTRANLDTLTLVTGNGDEFYVEDYRVFVQPEVFRDVITDLYDAARDDEAFIRQIWAIVTQLTIWTEEIGSIPRYPLEALLAGGGDCEDLSILFASMIKAAPVDWEVNLVYMDTSNPHDPQLADHVIVYIDTGAQTYLIETTSNQDMTPYPGGVTGWYFPIW